MELIFTDEEKKAFLSLAHNAIKAKLFEEKIELKGIAAGEIVCGAFVTLHLNGNLRGCIGNLAGTKPLNSTITQMAAASAFEDPRFPPLSKSEFELIDIEISVLSPMQKINSADEIKIGKHGVYLTKGFYSATFLPQVAPEQGWGITELMDNLCYKAGLNADAWKSIGCNLFVYTATVFGEKDFR